MAGSLGVARPVARGLRKATGTDSAEPDPLTPSLAVWSAWSAPLATPADFQLGQAGGKGGMGPMEATCALRSTS